MIFKISTHKLIKIKKFFKIILCLKLKNNLNKQAYNIKKVFKDSLGKEAITHYKILKTFGRDLDTYSLLELINF